MFQLAATRR